MLDLLIPVDGSDASLNAVKHAIKLVRENPPVSARLLFVHGEPVRLGDVGRAMTAQQRSDAERRHADPAMATAERMLREAEVSYERDSCTGDVASSIVRYAENHGCNAILMGTRAPGVLSGLLAESTAFEVIRQATVPVIVVK